MIDPDKEPERFDPTDGTDVGNASGLTMADLEEAMRRKIDSSAFRAAADAMPPPELSDPDARAAVHGLSADHAGRE